MKISQFPAHEHNFYLTKVEGEEKKSLQDILLSTAKVINLRVKSQARGQNNRSIALK